MEHWPCRGQCVLRHVFAPHAGQDAQAIEIRVLALAGPHAQRREALQQLTGVEPLLAGVDDVGDLQILVEVHKLLAFGVRKYGIGMRRRLVDNGIRRRGRRSAQAQTECGLRTRAAPIPDPFVKAVRSGNLPAGVHTRGEHVGHELLDGAIIADRAPRLVQ